VTRRDFLHSTAAAGLLGQTGTAQVPAARMGIATTSSGAAGQARKTAAGPARRGWDTYEYLEYCHALGAGGIQAQINGDIPKLRARAEQLGMYIEAMGSLPRGGDPAPFEQTLQNAKAAGATVVRAAALSERRYEKFSTLEEWQKFVAESHAAIKLAVPLLEKHRIGLALENHKDWTLEDFVGILKTYSSEYLGACIDFGNNIALLDDPVELVEGLAPWGLSTHVKDMGVAPYEDGFLLSEVVLGEGILDLKRLVSIVRKARPKTHLTLEMITRDPLQVPCLTDRYWTVFPGRSGRYLARTVKLVNKHTNPNKPLPRVSQLSAAERLKAEEDNNRACLRYAREQLAS
jgi:sugar phosphate isomerase/epimerase